MATNFGLTTSTPPVNVIQSINYLLASVGTVNASSNVNLGNVVQVSSNNAIFSNVGIIGYVNGYMDVKYANSATGSSGFTSNSTNANYYGIYNSSTNTESSNPADYQWTQVVGGFGTTKGLWYTTSGGNTISFQVSPTAPNQYYQPVPDNVPIVLATISNNLVTTNSIQSQAVTNVQIATATITNVQIAANTITANNIQANTITAQQIATGTITADKIAGNVLVANTIVSTGATLEVNSGRGFWFDGNTGNAYMGGNTTIGTNLKVGNNAVIGGFATIGSNVSIGGNLQVTGLITSGAFNANTVPRLVMQPNSVTSTIVTSTTYQPSFSLTVGGGPYYYPQMAANVTPNFSTPYGVTFQNVIVNAQANYTVTASGSGAQQPLLSATVVRYWFNGVTYQYDQIYSAYSLPIQQNQGGGTSQTWYGFVNLTVPDVLPTSAGVTPGTTYSYFLQFGYALPSLTSGSLNLLNGLCQVNNLLR